MTRREYQESCFTHLETKYRGQIDAITRMVEELGREVENSRNATARLHEEMRRIRDVRNTRLNSSNSNRVRMIDVRSVLKTSYNMRISSNPFDKASVYEILNCESYSYAFAQLSEPLTSFFKIRILSMAAGQYVIIGLTQNEHPIDELPGRKVGSIAYCHRGEVVVSGRTEVGLGNWKNGDIVECGLTNSNNFTNAASEIVEVYFSLNGAIVSRKNMTKPREGFFPTIRMGTFTDAGPKIQYLYN